MESLDFTIQKMDLTDIPQILEMISEFNLGNWSYEDLKAELKLESSRAFTARKGNKTIGFIITRLITNYNSDIDNKFPGFNENNSIKNADNIQPDEKAEIEIYNIGVHREYRRKQVGKLLIDSLLKEIDKKYSASIWLEVRESNKAAIDFYKSNSFKFCYKRKNFYSNPYEDAIVMRLEINP